MRKGRYGGRDYYQQRQTKREEEKFLYYQSEYKGWFVSDTLGLNAGWMRNPSTSQQPPRTGWFYWDGKKFRNDDPSLELVPQ